MQNFLLRATKTLISLHIRTDAHPDLSLHITRTYLYNFDPRKPHFYIVKLGFTWVHIIFLISAKKHRLWVLVRTASNEYTFYVLSRNMKNIRVYLSENFQFLEVKFSICLNRCVLVMLDTLVKGTFSHVVHYENMPIQIY